MNRAERRPSAPPAEDIFGGEDNAHNTAGLIDHLPSYGGSAALRCGNRIFPCIACGACCRNLGHAPLYASLDRGDGICCHFDISTNLCRIYESRPKICRVTDMFKAFEGRFSWDEYVDLNLQSCHELRARTQTPENPASTTNRKE